MNQYEMRAAITVVAAVAASAGIPITAEAASNYDLRSKVVSMAGITSGVSTDEFVTRAEFTQMLVNATSYKVVGKGTSDTAVFSDVPADSQYAAAIRIASENGWMTAYLGGLYRPDNQITVQEAARAVLSLLGYTNEDFPGSQIAGRWAQYQYLDLGENIGKEAQEIMTGRDCVNLFYNLLRTEMKNGQAYCTTLGYELSSDGEVNALTIADNELKGPKVVRRSYSISDEIPFDIDSATFYLDGEYSTKERINQEKQDGGFVVIYYNTASKTVWAYSAAEAGEETTSSQVAIKGEVTGIYYSSANVMTPSTVVLDDDTSVQYRLNNSDVQFAFSIYGNLKVGDEVILICQSTSGADGNPSYNVIDCLEY